MGPQVIPSTRVCSYYILPLFLFAASLWFSSGSALTWNAAKIAGPGRKRHSSDPDPCGSSSGSGSEVGDGRPISGKWLKMASSSTGPSESGRRRGQRGPDDAVSASKKKQKDKVNQESKEAKRAASGISTESRKGKERNWFVNTQIRSELFYLTQVLYHNSFYRLSFSLCFRFVFCQALFLELKPLGPRQIFDKKYSVG